ncbi:MAG TPA: YncE family protein [Ktedonobacteraceae bacterium]|nr:YncE family protein [Ktedonobacteraceae bacterium]
MQRKRYIRYQALLLCLGSISLFALFPLPVFADGGAPNLAYVAGSTQGVSVIDVTRQSITTTFPVKGDPQALYLSLDGRFLYVAQPAIDQVSMLAAGTGQVLCSVHLSGNPSLMAFDPITGALFVAGKQAKTISKIAVPTCRVSLTLEAKDQVSGLALNEFVPNNQKNQIWVASGKELELFDTETGQLQATIPFPGNPQALSLPLGQWVYATTSQGDIFAVSLQQPYRIVHLLSGGQFGRMDFDQISGEIYVPDQALHQVDVLVPPNPNSNQAPHEPVRVYHLSSAPQSVAITNDGAFGFIALSTGKVEMLDIFAREIINTFAVGGNPHFVITGLYPPIVGTTPQQATLTNTITAVATYALIILLLAFPLWFVWRKRKGKSVLQQDTQESEKSYP